MSARYIKHNGTFWLKGPKEEMIEGKIIEVHRKDGQVSRQIVGRTLYSNDYEAVTSFGKCKSCGLLLEECEKFNCLNNEWA